MRLATHAMFRDFVLGANDYLRGKVGPKGETLEGRLEFFDAGGDPRELMEYMVKSKSHLKCSTHPAHMPTSPRSCYPDDVLTPDPGLVPGIGSLINGDIGAKRRMTATYIKGFYNSTFFPDRRNGAFAADAIISNPPAFAHIHVAQSLGIPLHMSFSKFQGLCLSDTHYSHALDAYPGIQAPTRDGQAV